MTATQIKTLLTRGGVKKTRNMNLTRALSDAIPLVHREGARGEWAITGTGEEFVRRIRKLPDDVGIETQPASPLLQLSNQITDESTRDYVEESIKCLTAGALRASVVFLWSAAVHSIREQIWAGHRVKDIDTAFRKHNQRAKFTKKGDFEYMNDALLVEAATELGVFHRSEKKRLLEALDLRNDCGHPVKFKPGPNKVNAFIEDLTTIIFR